MRKLYQATLFLSAMLLFLVQPLYAKMLLPHYGGTPAVWTACMVFFQAVLLAGYGYAHLSLRWWGPWHQAVVQMLLLFAAANFLPFAGPTLTADESSFPVLTLLKQLTISLGVPFFVLSTMNPTLQQWYVQIGGEGSDDPYFLYAASNAGSVAGLLAYPFLLEPNLRLKEQGVLWTAVFGALILLTGFCAANVLRRKNSFDPFKEQGEKKKSTPITGRRRLRWIALAFVPSSLLLGVTQFITTDVAPIPLLWIIPLLLYLVSFIIVFSRRPIISHWWAVHAFGPMLGLLAFSSLFYGIWAPVCIHLATFFTAAMVCHGEMAADRPDAAHLTEFYFWMSTGGALGGVFNALLAPLLFSTTLEYPLAILAAGLLAPRLAISPELRQRANFVGLAAAAVLAIPAALTHPIKEIEALLLTAAVALPVMVYCIWRNHPRLLAISVGAVLIVANTKTMFPALFTSRSFFGVHRVSASGTGSRRFHQLLHGTTVHGMQRAGAGDASSCEPLTYYHPAGPLGQIFRLYGAPAQAPRVGVIGLGTGAVSSYIRRNQHVTFFEIDPIVKEIAEEPRYFRYLSDCLRGEAKIVLGDGRRQIAEEADGSFGLLILDAFSSDAVPMHLLTQEAIHLYRQKMTPTGVAAFHISSRFIDLAPILADAGAEAGMNVFLRNDVNFTPEQLESGQSPARYLVMLPEGVDDAPLRDDARWRRLAPRTPPRPWTDDYSNVLETLVVSPLMGDSP